MSMPGMRGIQHIGFTVPDIDEACDFFKNIVGAEVLFTADKNFRGEGDWMKKFLNIDPSCVIKEFRFLRCGNGTNLEIFEYEAPNQSQKLPLNSDIGGHHLAFYVDDMVAAVRYLKDKGVRVLGEPQLHTKGPNKGLTWCYFLAPWGMQMELVSAPNGTDYDNSAKKDGRTQLFHPVHVNETAI